MGDVADILLVWLNFVHPLLKGIFLRVDRESVPCHWLIETNNTQFNLD